MSKMIDKGEYMLYFRTHFFIAFLFVFIGNKTAFAILTIEHDNNGLYDWADVGTKVHIAS